MLSGANKKDSEGKIMLKLRITYLDETEKEEAIKNIEKMFKVLNVSRVYPGRGSSKFSNVYIDVELK